MKPLRFLVAAAALAATSVTGFAQEYWGAANFKFTAIQQNVYAQTNTVANTNSSSTNIIETILYTSATTNLDNQQLLNMLANSFNMTWPADATLKADGSGNFEIFNGSIGVQDVSSVLHLDASNDLAVTSGSVVAKGKISKNGQSLTETTKYTQMIPASLVYDDSALPTSNGNTTRITVVDIESLHGMMLATNSIIKRYSYLVDFSGTGTGSISNSVADTTFIVGGSVSGTTSGQ